MILVGKCDFVAGFDDTEYIWEAVLAHFDVFSVEDCSSPESFCSLRIGIFLQHLFLYLGCIVGCTKGCCVILNHHYCYRYSIVVHAKMGMVIGVVHIFPTTQSPLLQF